MQVNEGPWIGGILGYIIQLLQVNEGPWLVIGGGDWIAPTLLAIGLFSVLLGGVVTKHYQRKKK